jgi:hypothetical protein
MNTTITTHISGIVILKNYRCLVLPPLLSSQLLSIYNYLCTYRLDYVNHYDLVLSLYNHATRYYNVGNFLCKIMKINCFIERDYLTV